MCPHGRAHWRHLANTIEPSVCCSNAALCHITLTTCWDLRLQLDREQSVTLSRSVFGFIKLKSKTQVLRHLLLCAGKASCEPSHLVTSPVLAGSGSQAFSKQSVATFLFLFLEIHDHYECSASLMVKLPSLRYEGDTITWTVTCCCTVMRCHMDCHMLM